MFPRLNVFHLDQKRVSVTDFGKISLEFFNSKKTYFGKAICRFRFYEKNLAENFSH